VEYAFGLHSNSGAGIDEFYLTLSIMGGLNELAEAFGFKPVPDTQSPAIDNKK